MMCDRCGDTLPDHRRNEHHRTHTLWCSCGRFAITPFGVEIDESEERAV